MATYKPSWTELFTGIPSGKKIKEMEMEDIASGEIFDDYIKNRIQNLKDGEVLKNLPKISKDEKPKIVPKRKPQPDPKYEGPFGKLGEYLSKNESARNKLFDMLGSVGRELVRPTQPGEARGLLSDISAGVEKGEAQYSAEQAAAADAALKYAQARKAMDPEQYYTSVMKNVYDEAEKRGLRPGTTAYNEFVSERLRIANVSEAAKSIAELMDDARQRLGMSLGSPEEQEIRDEIDMYRNQLAELMGGEGGAMYESAQTAVYDAVK